MLRCPQCRTRRSTYGLLTRHIRVSGHGLCNCGGYHYAHRPGSPCCEQNPYGAYNDAKRRGCSREVLIDILDDVRWEFNGEPGGLEPPF